MKKILIVEDEAIVAMENKMNLTKSGYQVVGIISTAEDVMHKFIETSPDIILMDIKLKGDMTGIEVVKLIREKSNVPVLFLTGNSDNRTQFMMKEISNSSFLLKPVLTGDLISSIKQLLQLHSSI